LEKEEKIPARLVNAISIFLPIAQPLDAVGCSLKKLMGLPTVILSIFCI